MIYAAECFCFNHMVGNLIKVFLLFLYEVHLVLHRVNHVQLSHDNLDGSSSSIAATAMFSFDNIYIKDMSFFQIS